jgi:hypothetical protein
MFLNYENRFLPTLSSAFSLGFGRVSKVTFLAVCLE